MSSIGQLLNSDLEVIIFITYSIFLFFIFCYSFVQLSLVVRYRKGKKSVPQNKKLNSFFKKIRNGIRLVTFYKILVWKYFLKRNKPISNSKLKNLKIVHLFCPNNYAGKGFTWFSLVFFLSFWAIAKEASVSCFLFRQILSPTAQNEKITTIPYSYFLI